jgi:hypothetical protein
VAEKKGFIREIILRLNRDAARQMEEDTQDALEAAGKSGAAALEEAMQAGGNKAARALTKSLSDAYNNTIAEARVKLSKGLIDDATFARIRHQATETFDRGLVKGMERLQAEGKLTDNQFTRLAARLKGIGKEGPKEIGRVEAALGKVKAVALSVGTAIAAVFALRTLKRWGESAIQAALDAETSARRLLATWRANAGAVGKTFEDLQRFSKEVQSTTLFSADEIELAMAQLLSYKSIAGETFERTIRLGSDMASVFGGLERSTEALARALDDPIRGLGQLRKAGFTFEDSVLSQVTALTEQNRTLEAQSVLLTALEAEVGGVAREMKTGWVGALDAAKKGWLGVREAIGEALLEAGGGTSTIETLTGTLKGLETWVRSNSSQLSTLTGRLLDAAAAAAGFVETVMDMIDPAGQTARIHTAGLLRLDLDTEGWQREADKVGVEIERLTAEAARLEIELQAAAKGGMDTLFGFGAAKRAKESNQRIRDLRGEIQGIQVDIEGLGRVQEYALRRGQAQVKTTKQLAAEEAARRKAEEEAQERLRLETEKQIQERIRAQSQEIAHIRTAHGLRILTTAEMARALDLEREISRQLRNGTLALEDRIRLAQHLQTLEQVTPQARLDGPVDSMGVTGLKSREPQKIADPAGDELAALAAKADRWAEEVAGAGHNAAWGIAGAFQDAFSVLYDDFGNLSKAAETLGLQMSGALLGGVAEYASGKVKENIAASVEQTARAFAAFGTPLMGTHLKSAATHTLAAAKWGILAGAGGAGQSAVASGGRGGLSGGIPTGARDTTGRLLEERRGPEVHIYIDPLDPSNPAYQRNVYAAQGYARERYGDGAVVTVHPRGGR